MIKFRLSVLFVIVFLFSNLLSSCTKVQNDPFAENNTSERPETSNGTKSPDTVEEMTGMIVSSINLNSPDDGFYGLTGIDAVNKYGIFSRSPDNNNENAFDGKFSYMAYYLQTNPTSATLAKYEYPNGKALELVCKDPLCDHTVKSGCPLSNCARSTVVCHNDKIFIFAENGNLYMYDERSNKSKTIKKGMFGCAVFKFDDTLYVSYDGENPDFNSERIIEKISEDGTVTELGRVSDFDSTYLPVYKERYAIDFKPELLNNEGKIYVLSHDLQTGKAETVTEIECEGAADIDQTVPYMLYGNKLLIRCRYRAIYPNADSNDERRSFWLINLDTKEKQLICTPDYHTYQKSHIMFMFSTKCILWQEVRSKESEPMIVHILFPREDKELKYNISDMIKAETGDDLPLDDYVLWGANSAITFLREVNDIPVSTYEVDLENGNVYKYNVSDSNISKE